ncbi:MAG: hypothetical protein EA425_08225 [Puniceicoccaceae bacterium]|nr:MAG: hypothetical protein EA425_08225 [Puniceicoccaceae bacterium]
MTTKKSLLLLGGGCFVALLIALGWIRGLGSEPAESSGFEVKTSGPEAVEGTWAPPLATAAAPEPPEVLPEAPEPAPVDYLSRLATLSETPWSLDDLSELVAGMQEAQLPDFLIRSLAEKFLSDRIKQDPEAFVDAYPHNPNVPEHPSRKAIQARHLQHRILADLFGSHDYGWTELRYSGFRSAFGNIPVERYMEIEATLEQNQHELHAAQHRRASQAERVLLRLAVVDDLRSILSPDELIEFELHRMPYGNRLQRLLPDEKLSRDELRQLLDEQRRQYLDGMGVVAPE